VIRKIFKIFFGLFVGCSLVVTGSFYLAATSWRSKADAEVSIPRGASVRTIAALLSKEGVIATPRLLELFVRFKGIAGSLKAGTYDFPEGTNMLSVLEKLEKGDIREYELVIIEGWTIDDIAKAIEGKAFVADDNAPAEFKRLAMDRSFAKELGIDATPSLEGYLFPDTYKVSYPLDVKVLLARLVGRFNEVWRELTRELGDGGVPKNELITLASIVEKETGAPSERALIAGVFKNRLQQGMLLQSDPTIIYGLPNFDGVIRKNDISNPHSYNTYVHSGLPPGPICNPGRASLAATLRPEETDYIYFVSKNDGTHFFSETLTDHINAVKRYREINGR
jgi:UPF0755 protein